MKLFIMILSLTFITACASKKTNETAALTPASTTTPTVTAAKPEVEKTVEMKKEKKSVKKTTETTVGTAEVNCKAAADERKLAIQVKDAGCELQYTKANEMKVIASQISGSEKCEEVMTAVKEKLAAAQFDCK